jgi:hypothetical protein
MGKGGGGGLCVLAVLLVRSAAPFDASTASRAAPS